LKTFKGAIYRAVIQKIEERIEAAETELALAREEALKKMELEIEAAHTRIMSSILGKIL
jgi:hypothetical protein